MHDDARQAQHRAPVLDIAVDASGGLLATAGADRAVRVFDVDGGFCTHAFTGKHTCALLSLPGPALPWPGSCSVARVHI